MTDGRSARAALDELEERLALEAEAYELSGATPEDQPKYERHTEPLKTLIAHILADVRQLMLEQGTAGKWFAFGRRHPDAEMEVIPSRYWPFLSLEISNRVARGEDIIFRDLRCLYASEIPEDHFIWAEIDAAQNLNKPRPMSQSGSSSEIHPRIEKTGLPGRPTLSRHLIDQLFEDRVGAGTLEPSLNKEAKVLVALLSEKHPDAPKPTPKTVANNIRARYRNAQPPPSP